ncbi:hypothetical protein TNCV_2849181 [Trichonephila clavipes]|nr:hypothetical protein TNCV_2849181 [Trichonephila clavipes]
MPTVQYRPAWPVDPAMDRRREPPAEAETRQRILMRTGDQQLDVSPITRAECALRRASDVTNDPFEFVIGGIMSKKRNSPLYSPKCFAYGFKVNCFFTFQPTSWSRLSATE